MSYKTLSNLGIWKTPGDVWRPHAPSRHSAGRTLGEGGAWGTHKGAPGDGGSSHEAVRRLAELAKKNAKIMLDHIPFLHGLTWVNHVIMLIHLGLARVIDQLHVISLPVIKHGIRKFENPL